MLAGATRGSSGLGGTTESSLGSRVGGVGSGRGSVSVFGEGILDTAFDTAVGVAVLDGTLDEAFETAVGVGTLEATGVCTLEGAFEAAGVATLDAGGRGASGCRGEGVGEGAFETPVGGTAEALGVVAPGVFAALGVSAGVAILGVGVGLGALD